MKEGRSKPRRNFRKRLRLSGFFDIDGNPLDGDPFSWTDYRESLGDGWRIALTEWGDASFSTVYTGLDLGAGRPRIFETKIDIGDEPSVVIKCCTREEAKAQHDRFVKGYFLGRRLWEEDQAARWRKHIGLFREAGLVSDEEYERVMSEET